MDKEIIQGSEQQASGMVSVEGVSLYVYVCANMQMCLCVVHVHMCTHVLQIPCRDICRNVRSGEVKLGLGSLFEDNSFQAEWDQRKEQKGHLPVPGPSIHMFM